MELLSASRAVELGNEVRYANITNYRKKTLEAIMGRIQEVINEGFASGGVSVEQYVDDWSCEPAGWCLITLCAPSVELCSSVMADVENRLERLGYQITTSFSPNERITVISW